MSKFKDIAIALAGVCQSAGLVHQIASRGEIDHQFYQSTLSSLLVFQPQSTLDVFNNDIKNLKYGIDIALAQLGGKPNKFDTQISKYWIGLLALSRKLAQNHQAKITLIQRLNNLERQVMLCEGDYLEEVVINSMSSIYSDIISPLGTPIKVFGMPEYLQRSEIQSRVRALLLAGIRSGMLWQQVGGNRWQFFFSRNKILTELRTFYSSL